MKPKNLIGVNLIGWYKIFGALMVLFSLNVQQTPAFNVRFAVPFIPELIVKISVALSSIIISYGYLRQTKWGYWGMLIYSVLFCCLSLFQITKYGTQPFIGNAIYSAIVAIYTLIHNKYFTSYIVSTV